MPPRFSDAHLHPCDITEPYPDHRDAEIILGCSTRPEDWDELTKLEDSRMIRFYGVHPWYVSEWNEEVENRLESIVMDDIRSGIGEIGLDSKKGSIMEQMTPFIAQLDIARRMDRPVNVHMVGCEKEMLDTLHSTGNHRVILHGFNNESYSKAFAEIGCYMSINPRILKRSSERISRLIASIPSDRILLETDHPFTPQGFQGMGQFASELSDATGIPKERLLETTSENTRRLIYG